MIAYQDAEVVVRGWLIGLGVAGGRVYLSLPEGPRTMPCVLVTRVGGASSFATDEPRIQFDCFGNDKAEAAGLAYGIAAALTNLRPARGSALAGATVETLFPQSGPTDPYRRFVLDATISVRTQNAA